MLGEERLLVHSGLYSCDGQITRRWSFNLTSVAKKRLRAGKTGIGVSVRAMTSAPAWPEPEDLGHCNSVYGTGSRPRNLAPHLHVELEDAASK